MEEGMPTDCSSSDRFLRFEYETGVEVAVNGDDSRKKLAWQVIKNLDAISAKAIRLLESFMRDRGTFEFEIVPGMELHSHAVPEVQQALVEGVVEWATRAWPREAAMSTADRIVEFLDAEILDDPTLGGPVAAGDPLADGRLDSLAMEQLITFIEDEFALSFDDEEFVAENFASIDALAAFVDAKRAVPSPV